MCGKSGRRVPIRRRIPYHRSIGFQAAFLHRGRLNASGHIVKEKGNKMLLGVNIDHVATLRNARGTTYPSPVEAALVAETHGADLITLHLREDRRHMKDADVFAVKNAIRTRLNLEMALTEEMLENALQVRPEDVCIVPEKRQEITTEGGLDVLAQQDKVAQYVKTLTDAGIRVSLFIDADGGQIQAAHEVGAPVIELVRNPGILGEGARAPHRPRVVVGFAAETGTDEEVAAFGRAKARRKGADLMAVNRVGQGEGFGDVPNRIEVLDADGRSVGAASGTKDDVAEYLVGLIAGRLATLSA